MQNSLHQNKSILKFNSLSNIDVFKLLLAACFHIILSSKHTKCSLRQPNFHHFTG